VRRDDERLADIFEAADKIAVRAAKGRAACDADDDTQIVPVHLIQVTGEAAAGLSDGFIPSIPRCPGARSSPPATASCKVTSRSISTFPVGRGCHRRAELDDVCEGFSGHARGVSA